jgi:hypothetical protein
VTTDDHSALLDEALKLEAEGHRALLAHDDVRARDELRAASDRYRASWEAAPPDAYGRLVGMLKAAVLIGEAETAARYVHTTIGDEPASPTAAYAVAIAALVHGSTSSPARRPASCAVPRTPSTARRRRSTPWSRATRTPTARRSRRSSRTSPGATRI